MRIMLAGTSSGSGKTTASMLLMAALKMRGLSVAPYKVGPDYVDTGFHRAVCARACYNLDGWLMKKGSLLSALRSGADVSVIEGVMGYYDGLDPESFRCSSYETARLTQTPVILVADASGGAASVAATVKGFQTLTDDSGIAGVLVDRVSGEGHYRLIERAVRRYTGLPCMGYLTKYAKLELPSRQLGLVPAGETENVVSRVFEAAEAASKTLDLDGILEIAKGAPELPEVPAEPLPDMRGRRIGVAMDEAFCFYYQACIDALERAGAQLAYFSPIRDEALPDGVDALYIGGGYPEVFAEELSRNRGMRGSIMRALGDGLRCYAECGGLLYLGQELDGRGMAGFLPCAGEMTDRLQRFGYVTVEDRTGLSFPAHEFHHALARPLDGARFAYRLTKASDPGRTWECGYEKKNTLAAFAHAYFADRPELIGRFFG